MPIHPRPRNLALISAALLAACSSAPDDAENAAVIAQPDNAAVVPPLNATGEQSDGVLVPPAPGEPGGLPDDRRPLDEGAMKDPTSVAASGTTIEMWGFALADGRYDDAYQLWAGKGAKSGMSEAEFARAYGKYSEIHVLVGRPEAVDADTVRAPVQMYGRLRQGGTPFNLYGPMTLERNPAGQKGQPGEMPWLISGSDLKPRGEVKVSTARAATQAHLIPAGFQGKWSKDRASCSKPGDTSRLRVHADTLVFYESQGKVTDISFINPGEIQVTAAYQGEGENWSRTSMLTLSGGEEALTVDGFRRVRCAA